MAEAIPLNEFVLLAIPLISGSNVIYQNQTKNVSAIILSAQIANITTSSRQVSVKVQKSGSASMITVFNNFNIPPNEALNPLSGKLVLQKYDALIFQTAVGGSLEAVLSVLENAND
jgi:hypothetical protein